MSNEDILNQIKDNLKNIVPDYSFNMDKNQPRNLRYPNDKEKRNWMKDVVQDIYFWGKTSMGYSTYKTLRGHIRRNQFDVVFKCLRNKRYCASEEVDRLISSFEKFCNSKTIETIAATITFTQPVKRVSIDIYVSPERVGSVQ